jgi:hypothetical protein
MGTYRSYEIHFTNSGSFFAIPSSIHLTPATVTVSITTRGKALGLYGCEGCEGSMEVFVGLDC